MALEGLFEWEPPGLCFLRELYDTPCESVLRQCHKAWVCSLNLLRTHYLEITSLKTTSVCMFGVPDSPICRITQGPAWGGPGLSPKPCLLYFSPSHWATEIPARQTCSCCLKAFLLLFPSARNMLFLHNYSSWLTPIPPMGFSSRKTFLPSPSKKGWARAPPYAAPLSHFIFGHEIHYDLKSFKISSYLFVYCLSHKNGGLLRRGQLDLNTSCTRTRAGTLIQQVPDVTCCAWYWTTAAEVPELTELTFEWKRPTRPTSKQTG